LFNAYFALLFAFLVGLLKSWGSKRPNPVLEGIESRSENTYSGGVNYLFELGGKRRKRIKVAQKQYEAAQKDYEITEHELRMHLRRFYSKFATDLERLNIKENSVNLATELVDITKRRYEAGDVPAIDIKVAEQAQLTSQSELLNLQNDLIHDRISLNELLVIEPSVDWKPSTSLKELSQLGSLKSTDEIIKVAMLRRADLQKLTYDLQAAEAQLALSKANRIPNIQENFAVVAANGLNLSSSSPDVFTVNVRTDTSIEIPAFNRQQGPIAEAKAKINKLTYDQAALKNQVRSEVSAAYARLQATQDKIELAQKTVKVGEEIADLMQKGYQAGRMNLSQVVLARQNLKQAQDSYYSMLLDYQDSISDLEKSLDGPVSEAQL
jgi:outer membrane protein, heavy metal efflux system